MPKWRPTVALHPLASHHRQHRHQWTLHLTGDPGAARARRSSACAPQPRKLWPGREGHLECNRCRPTACGRTACAARDSDTDGQWWRLAVSECERYRGRLAWPPNPLHSPSPCAHYAATIRPFQCDISGATHGTSIHLSANSTITSCPNELSISITSLPSQLTSKYLSPRVPRALHHAPTHHLDGILVHDS